MSTAQDSSKLLDVTVEDIARLFDNLISTNALVKFVAACAESRDMKWLRCMLDAGVATRAADLKPSDKRSLLDSLLTTANDGVSAQWLSIIGDWERALDVSKTSLQAGLSTLNDRHLVHQYAQRGADPNAPSEGHGYRDTALHNAVKQGRFESALAMLEVLIDRGQMPLVSAAVDDGIEPRNLFNAILNKNYGPAESKIFVQALCETTLPRAWLEEMGWELSQYKAPRVAGTVIHEREFVKLLALAEFDSTAHFADVIAAQGTYLPFRLVTSVANDENERLLTRILESSINPDNIGCEIYEGGKPCAKATMLHAAVLANNIDAVSKLLNAGADPYKVVEEGGTSSVPHTLVGADAFGIALSQSYTDAAALLDAWRARRAIDSVLKAAPAARGPCA